MAAPTVRILFLIDECVPHSVALFLRDRGHDVRFVRDLFLPGTEDPVIATLGDEWSAIVVTWNHKDFKKLVARVPTGQGSRFRRLGRISFRMNETKGRSRVEQLIEWIEFEYAQVQRLRDRRLLIEIGETRFNIIR